ncbi:ABC transporter permease [Luedemannella helvata]|uniref:ABC transporter permease n=1 Tax=Luedemannella helvata TaxID=349315 RepID=A0ABP4WTC8_9ACTN
MTQVISRPVATPAAPPLTPAHGRLRRLGPGRAIPGGRLAGPLLIVAAWSAASAAGVLDDRILPAPWTIWHTTTDLISSGRLQDNLLTSLQRAGLGFTFGLTAGLVLALISGLSRTGEALVDGPVQLKRSIPSLGLIPLMILWLGIGEGFKVVIIALGVAIPIYINTHVSLIGIDRRYVELAEVLRLSRTRFLRSVVFPAALPGFLTGLRLAVTGSWLSLVVIEQINATSGIGYMMYQAQNYGQSDIIIVGLIVYGVFGLASDALVRMIGKRVLSWQQTLGS